MKTLVKAFILTLIVTAGTWSFPQRVAAQNEEVSLQVFYDELSPYGTWIEDSNYGYVWVPRVDRDFSPYVTNGHWVYTDYGWTWVSDYPWGWAPFHYGRWYEDPEYGYVWVPDTEWGPAWVTWRQANGYLGWAPMGPGVNIDIALGRTYNIPRERWVFVRDRDFMQINLFPYCLERSLLFRIFDYSILIRNTRFDNYRHTSYFFGPRREDVQRYSGRVINPVHVRDYYRPGQSYDRGYLNIYRPQVQRRNINGNIPVPREINRSRNTQYYQQPNANPVRNQREIQSSRNQNTYYQNRNAQPAQQPAVNQQRNQRENQSSRNGNTYYQNRNVQPAQQPAVNQQQNQRENQSSRNANTYYQNRNVQPAQQPAVNPQQNQRENQSSRNANPYYQNRNVQPAQQPAVNQQQNRREVQPNQNVRPSENMKDQKAKMVVNPEKNKKERSSQRSNEEGPRR